MSHDLNKLIANAARIKASDIHIKSGIPSVVRMPDGLKRIKEEIWTTEEVLATLKTLVGPEAYDLYLHEGEADGGYATPEEGIRVRVNGYKEKGQPGIVMRILPTPPTLTDLKMEEDMKPFLQHKDGLVIVTGPTGSGKSSTLSGIINHINLERACHIVTIEDPIEYVYNQKQAIITQREIGNDTKDFPQALRRVLRQDPDVIVIGESRDAETMKAALAAAETGHLVFTTLHAVNAKETISRILEMFPAEEHKHIRHLLGGVLRGIVAQRLIPTQDGGRVALQEIMVGSDRALDVIKDPEKTSELDKVMEAGEMHGMRTFNQSLVRLVKQERIAVDVAMQNSQAKQNLKLLLESEIGREAMGQKTSTVSIGVE